MFTSLLEWIVDNETKTHKWVAIVYLRQLQIDPHEYSDVNYLILKWLTEG